MSNAPWSDPIAGQRPGDVAALRSDPERPPGPVSEVWAWVADQGSGVEAIAGMTLDPQAEVLIPIFDPARMPRIQLDVAGQEMAATIGMPVDLVRFVRADTLERHEPPSAAELAERRALEARGEARGTEGQLDDVAAFLVDDAEGLGEVPVGFSHYPTDTVAPYLVPWNRMRIEAIRAEAQSIATRLGQPVKLVRFSNRQPIETALPGPG